MALTESERKLLEKLQAKENSPDAEDYEVRVRHSDGSEASVPASRAKGWIKEKFGIDLFDEIGDGEQGDGDGDGQGDEGDGDGGGAPSRSYFKGKAAAKKPAT